MIDVLKPMLVAVVGRELSSIQLEPEVHEASITSFIQRLVLVEARVAFFQINWDVLTAIGVPHGPVHFRRLDDASSDEVQLQRGVNCPVLRTWTSCCSACVYSQRAVRESPCWQAPALLCLELFPTESSSNASSSAAARRPRMHLQGR